MSFFGYTGRPGTPRRLAAPLILISVLTIGVLVQSTLAWKRGYWGILGRLHHSAVALSAVTFRRAARLLQPARVRHLSRRDHAVNTAHRPPRGPDVVPVSGGNYAWNNVFRSSILERNYLF